MASAAITLAPLLEAAAAMAPGSSARAQYAAVAALLGRHFPGDPVSPRTVEKWFERDSITGAWLIRLVVAAQAEGRKLDILACMSEH